MRQTVLYITHDQEEAFAIADRIVLLRAGKVEQSGSPREIYRHPASLFVASFLGLTNLLQGEVVQLEGRPVIRTAIGDFPAQGDEHGNVTVLLRPDSVDLDGQGEFHLRGKVVEASFRGSASRAIIAAGDIHLAFEFPSNVAAPAEGQEVEISFDPQSAIQVFKGSRS
jgi:ABC-type Fe3+/spermidine/putrescine transport system ATPase subunit